MRDSMRLFITLLQNNQINGTISHTWIIQSSIVLMKLLHSQSQKEVYRFLYNLHQKVTPASHSSVIFLGSLLAILASKLGGGRGGGVAGRVLPYKRLMGMRRWMGSHFQDWIDYNGVAFSKELLEWGRTFSDFWVRKFVYLRLANVPECLYCRWKVKCSSFTL